MILHLSQRFFTDARTFITFASLLPATQQASALTGRLTTDRVADCRYLCSQVSRARVRSYGESSAVTLSPAIMRM